ncbi:MAG: ABC transporter ATP-binding protein [Oscillospiraceae bacterium]|nr:ABC transporter ATP-binding protein [Oscillospiraceae bacterium]
MIEVKNLSKSFDGFKALDDLTLTVPTGAVYGLVGPNGAGKSTLIRHLMGVYRPDCGEVTVNGQPVYENTAVKQTMVCIPDEIYYHTGDTIKDLKNLYKGIYPKFDDDRFERLKEVFHLDEKKQVRRFSKGMQKQLAFWLAISCRPEILVLDEPVDGLDPVMRRQIMSIILEDVAENGTTVLVSSHNLRELEDICDHVGIMHQGSMMLERSLSSLQENMVKIQLVMEAPLPKELDVVHHSAVGRVQTIIARGGAAEAERILNACEPILCDVLPLSLEEVFIYELGGVDYEVKNVLL